MQGRSAAYGANHLHARALTVGTFYIDNLITLANTEVDGLLGELVQLLHGFKSRISDIESGFD